jgi:long-chain acyl-CoA synthetase
MEIKRTFDLLQHCLESYPPREDVLAGKKDGKWIKYSLKDYMEIVNLVGYGLYALGLEKGDKVALISNNRPEWNFADMGMSQAGIVNVPIYPTISTEEYTYILQHAEPKIVLVSDKGLYQKLKPVVEKIPTVQKMYSFSEVEGAPNWNEILELGKKNADKFREKLETVKASIKPDDMVTMIYTSGTTGFPKGVMLSHWNLVSNYLEISKVHNFDHTSKALSFLPLSHIYERMVNYHFQYKGIGVYYAESMATIINDVKEVKPDLFNSVPRLLERVYDGIIGKGKDLPYLKKQIFFWAVNLGMKFKMEGNSSFYKIQHTIADKLVFSKWRAALGGNTKVIVSGGAALQPRLGTIFSAAGIQILEGYGLTETSPVIAANNLVTREIKIGTVGPVLHGVTVKIADDGEILCKGPNVMMGYYKQPDMTKEAIDEEGWFHTGDIGIIVENKYLKITDRKKEIFKLSSGKYVAPQVIENRFKESFFIEQIMVVGENEKFASALIAPNFEFLHNWCFLHHVKFHDNNELIQVPEVVARYQREVNEINKGLAFHEQIKRFRLVVDEWTPQTGELSPTLKLKRTVLYEKYETILKEIYMYSNGE